MSLYAPTAAEFDSIEKAIQTTAQKIAAKNKPRRRHSSAIQQDIDRLIGNTHVLPQVEGDLPCARRQLAACESRRTELSAALDKLTAQLAALKAEGVHPSRYEHLTGFDFTNKAEQKTHHDGSIDIVKGELERLDRRIVVLTEAVRKLEERVSKELPLLKAELEEALRMERLGA